MKQPGTDGLKASIRGTLLLFLLTAMLFTGPGKAQPARAAATTGCPSGQNCIFLPKLSRPAYTIGDLELMGLEITQAVQDPKNSVPLVAGRNTLLRLFARSVGVSRPVGDVKIIISASAASQALMGSPNAFSTTIPLSYDRASLKSTINVALPQEWTYGTIDITVRLDPGNNIGETNENNNTITKRLVFRNVAPLKLVIVPVRYENPNDKKIYPAPTTDTISEWILRTYPVPQVNVSFHDPITFNGNLSSYQGFVNLLDKITALKNSENQPPSVVYYGMVPISTGTSTWFYGGIAGIGWVGSRSSVGLNIPGTAAQIAGHEIGHNFGLWHSPCGNVDPTTIEANYPYSDGSIGQFGISMNRENTTQTLVVPTTKDVMSYCPTRWISDYVYKKLFTAQSQVQAEAASLQSPNEIAQQGLMVRAQINGSSAELLPAYILPGATSAPEAGEYQVEVLGLSGEVIAQVPVRAYTADANVAEQAAGINALVPLPDQPAARFRLLKDGRVLAEQALVTDMSLSPGSSSGSRPALVRYSRDGGETWVTLGIDESGGELLNRAANPEPGVIYQVIPAGAAGED